MVERHDVLNLAECYQLGGITYGIFASRLLEEGKSEVRTDDWPTTASSTDVAGAPLLRILENGSERAIFERDGALTHLSVGGGRLYAAVAAADAKRADAELSSLRGLF